MRAIQRGLLRFALLAQPIDLIFQRLTMNRHLLQFPIEGLNPGPQLAHFGFTRYQARLIAVGTAHTQPIRTEPDAVPRSYRLPRSQARAKMKSLGKSVGRVDTGQSFQAMPGWFHLLSKRPCTARSGFARTTLDKRQRTGFEILEQFCDRIDTVDIHSLQVLAEHRLDSALPTRRDLQPLCQPGLLAEPGALQPGIGRFTINGGVLQSFQRSQPPPGFL